MVHHANQPYDLGSFAVSPPNVLYTSATTGDPQFAPSTEATITVVTGYAEFQGLYYACADSDGAVPCNISATGYDVDGNAVPEIILHYTQPLMSRSLMFAAPAEGPPIKYVNATFRVAGSQDAPFETGMLIII
ncbi:hypothetical protein B0A55_00256 [Friedmanniomyces simplex]|uniref:Uncharacterized protein n=1 Tax=Friedmanniomyces simplex TaxID=329884 RepID=A0A4U0Y3A7_9PEZI|nr:hypothetical protein B0A55_00256 [Friedmanniomyces simplex]